MRIYITLGIVFVLSFGAALFFPTEDILKGIFASPGILALFGVLYQAFRDKNTHERSLELQKRQQIFNLGATSHMANVAFDKHVEFCEKYMKEVHETVVTLFREGPTALAMEHANQFHILRQEYAAWLTDEINGQLFPFEQALRSMGAEEHFIKRTRTSEKHGEQHSKKIDRVYSEFKRLLTLEQESEPDPEIAVEAVKKKVRNILDIEDLVQLRKSLINEANKISKNT